MTNRRPRFGIAVMCVALASSFATLAFAEDRRDGEVFSRVMRAIRKDCPLISDPAGNAGLNPMDFTALFVANDSTNFYFLVQYAGDASKNTRTDIFLDIDKDQATGCQLPPGVPRELSGRDAVITLLKKGTGDSYVNRVFSDCSFPGSGDGLDQAGFATAVSGHFIAVILPISTYNQLVSEVPPPGPNGPGFIIQVQAEGTAGPAFYRQTF